MMVWKTTQIKKTTLTKHFSTYIHCQWKIEIFLINLYKISVEIHQKPGGIYKKSILSSNEMSKDEINFPAHFLKNSWEKKSQ